MARPHLTLEKWLSTETNLKKEFLDLESHLNPNQIRKIVKPGKKDCYSSINYSLSRQSGDEDLTSRNNQLKSNHINQLIHNHLKFETDEFFVEMSDEHFEILKKKFLLFKYNNKNKKSNRVTKQITLDQNTLKELNRIKEKYSFKSLHNCLEFLIDRQNSQLTEKNKIISTLKKNKNENNDSNLRKKMELKDEEITQLKIELEHQKHTINENMSLSAKEFEQHLLDLAVSKMIELEKIKAFLGEISQEDQQTINETLAPEVLSQIETQLRNECAEQKQLLIMQKRSNLNSALGFDQHSQYGNTVQNDDEVKGISNNERSNLKIE